MDTSYVTQGLFKRDCKYDANLHYRLIFTHQQQGLPFTPEDGTRGSDRLRDMTASIVGVFASDQKIPMTEFHRNRLHNKKAGVQDLKVDELNGHCTSIPKFIKLESVVAVQQMVICTCIVAKKDLGDAVAGPKMWIDAIKAKQLEVS
jgi:hypothetical protein